MTTCPAGSFPLDAADQVQTARVWVPPQQVTDLVRVTRIQHAILDKIAALPGVEAAAFASAAPMEGPLRVWQEPVIVEGREEAIGTAGQLRRIKTVSPVYFAAIRDSQLFRLAVNTADLAARVEPTPLPIKGFAQAEYRRQFDLMPDGRQLLMLFPLGR